MTSFTDQLPTAPLLSRSASLRPYITVVSATRARVIWARISCGSRVSRGITHLFLKKQIKETDYEATFSMTAAIPCPPPIQSEATPYLKLLRLSSYAVSEGHARRWHPGDGR